MEGIIKLIPQEYKEMAMQLFSQPLFPVIISDFDRGKIGPGSTDVGDVSWVTPLGQFTTACYVMGALGHAWQNVATSGMSIGHKGMITAAKVLTLTAIDFMNDPKLVEKAQQEFEETTKGKTYKTPFPDGYKPPFHRLKDERFAIQS